MKRVRSFYLILLLLAGLSLSDVSFSPGPQPPAPDEKPFGLPFAEPPGPSTWLLIQPYGNTATAHRWRRSQYGAGQGVHFGVDLAAACGTPVVAIGDGTVNEVDDLLHGAAPHNLMIHHPNGTASFYGHLLNRPPLAPGQPVVRGQVVGQVGDPDGMCSSRPHLHLEIRDAPGHSRAYNPVLFIDADWESLALVGASPMSFSRNLDDPRRWQFMDDQPEVTFGGALLNNYTRAWPLDWADR